MIVGVLRARRTFVGTVALGVAACGLSCGSRDVTLVAHDFETSAQGWVVAGDSGVVEPIFNRTDGNPGGYIASDDEAIGETWYFRAPRSVLERLAEAEHGTISYSLKQSEIDAGFIEDDIILEGPAGRLSYRFATAPGTEWTAFSVRLSASEGWRWNWNAPATQEQMRSVLVNPTRLGIRGEHRTGPDVGGLDHFVLAAAP